jgi:hypothetical protein
LADDLDAINKPDASEAFRHVQQLVRWHYQWIIVHEYLPMICGQSVVADILQNGRKFYDWRNLPFIPVEFSTAAFRFGHTQARPGYQINNTGDGGNPFKAFIFRPDIDHSVPDPNDLSGGKRAARRFVDWSIFFEGIGPGTRRNKQIDSKISTPLFHLPTGRPGLPGPGEQRLSLAQRNLLRGLTFGLPSGQNVAAVMTPVIGNDPLTPGELSDLEPLGFHEHTPLWFYILKEAEAREGGNRLGPVGARIVAEVFIRLLQGDSLSYLAQNPTWVPTLSPSEDFKMAELLKFAGVAP